MRRTKRKYTISQAVKDKKPKVAFTGYSNLGGLKVPSIVLNKFKKGKLSEESFIKNVVKYNADKMSGEPEKVVRSALLVTADRVSLVDRLDYLEEQSRRLSFWNKNENREERSYRASLMSAMNKMNKKDLRSIYEDVGSTIDLDTWTYSEKFQGMIKVVDPSNLEDVFVLSFDREFNGDYESNVLTLRREKLKDLSGGLKNA